MKKLIYLFPILLIGFFTSCDFNTSHNAAKYSDSIIVEKINPLIEIKLELNESFIEFKPDVMSAKYKAFEDYIEKIEKELSEMKDYHGDATLLDGGKDLVGTYKKILPLYNNTSLKKSSRNFTESQ
jgi:hypothetical protein